MDDKWAAVEVQPPLPASPQLTCEPCLCRTQMNSTAFNTTAQYGSTRGWVGQSNDRGTLDIVISCAITTFLCIWTCVCVNVPGPGQGSWDIFRDRWHMFCLGMLGPEFILMSAIGQHASAKASTLAFKRLKHTAWTLKHSYFADMGGIHVQFPGSRPFPVDAKQLHYLVSNHFIQYPSKISLDIIKDKNKTDGLSRFIASVQMFWFTLSTVTRPIKNLAVTTLEITTLGYIICTLGTLYFWRDKPMDIYCPVVLDCQIPLEQILGDRMEPGDQWYCDTPLDYISREEWIGSRLWTYYVNILRRMRVVHVRPMAKPKQRFSSFNFPALDRKMMLLTLLLALCYTAVFVAGWNCHYNSHTERIMWRISSLGTMIIVLIGGVFEISFAILDSWKGRGGFTGPDTELAEQAIVRASPTKKSHKTKWKAALDEFRNNSPEKDPALDIPIRSLMITTPLCALYTIFRIFILTEDIISLRELPVSAFVAIEWSTYVPHI